MLKPTVGPLENDGLGSPEISRSKILERIDSELNSLEQWIRHPDFSRAAEYNARAEALIELLEIADCGSTGGYGKRMTAGGMFENQPTYQTLAQRFEWLKMMPTKRPD